MCVLGQTKTVWKQQGDWGWLSLERSHLPLPARSFYSRLLLSRMSALWLDRGYPEAHSHIIQPGSHGNVLSLSLQAYVAYKQGYKWDSTLKTPKEQLLKTKTHELFRCFTVKQFWVTKSSDISVKISSHCGYISIFQYTFLLLTHWKFAHNLHQDPLYDLSDSCECD